MRQVVVNTRGWIGGRAEPAQVDVQLRFDPKDALAVTVIVTSGSRPRAWVFSRDLLADGIRSVAPLGEGEVTVQATAVLTDIGLRSWDGSSTVLRLPWWTTREFVRLTEEEVPRGCEPLDVDAWVDALTQQ